jgi:hypothetical protein
MNGICASVKKYLKLNEGIISVLPQTSLTIFIYTCYALQLAAILAGTNLPVIGFILHFPFG